MQDMLAALEKHTGPGRPLLAPCQNGRAVQADLNSPPPPIEETT